MVQTIFGQSETSFGRFETSVSFFHWNFVPKIEEKINGYE